LWVLSRLSYKTPISEYITNHPYHKSSLRDKDARLVMEQKKLSDKQWLKMPFQIRHDYAMRYYGVDTLCKINHIHDNAINNIKKEWVDNFIEECGGIESMFMIYKELFMTLEPKYLPKGYLQLEFSE
jgi:hypothetical protein